MKRKFTFILTLFLALAIITAFKNTDRWTDGSPGGYTGSPGDSYKDCTTGNCHNGTATQTTGEITSNAPLYGYTPGSTYTISVKVSGTGSKGFQASPQTITGTLVGTLTAGTGTKIVSSKYINQLSGSTSNPKTWTFSWKAPAAGAGSVTFYCATTVAMSITRLSTLVIPECPSSVEEQNSSTFQLFPNPVCNDLHIQYTVSRENNVSVDLYSLHGTLVKPLLNEATVQPGEYIKTFSISDCCSDGIYLVKLSIGNKARTEKIIIKP